MNKNLKAFVGIRSEAISGSLTQLRNIPRTRCAHLGCGRAISYMNPMLRCYGCKKKFCYDHINCLQVNHNTKLTDALRDVCDQCKSEGNYQHYNEFYKK